MTVFEDLETIKIGYHDMTNYILALFSRESWAILQQQKKNECTASVTTKQKCMVRRKLICGLCLLPVLQLVQADIG